MSLLTLPDDVLKSAGLTDRDVKLAEAMDKIAG